MQGVWTKHLADIQSLAPESTEDRPNDIDRCLEKFETAQ